ncbi:MAG: nucleoside-diphosphate kinase [Thermomicrobiales bacterium]
MAIERTLIIIKPDGVQRGLIGEILGRLERRGLKFVGLEFRTVDAVTASKHYGEHQGKPFYDGLIEYITSGPSVLGVLEGPNAVAVTRSTIGATNPVNAAPGTIRGDLGVMTGRNLIHGSDSTESAAREVTLFFGETALPEWTRDTDRWILE